MSETEWVTKVTKTPEGMVVDMPTELMSKLNWEDGELLLWAMLPDADGFLVKKIDREKLENATD